MQSEDITRPEAIALSKELSIELSIKGRRISGLRSRAASSPTRSAALPGSGRTEPPSRPPLRQSPKPSPAAARVAEPVAKPVAEPAADQAADWAADKAAGKTADLAADLAADQAVDLPAEPAAEPAAEPTTEPTMPEHTSDVPRILCLHGWLDNAASFLPLMEHLPEADIVAIDFPGSGRSEWLEGGYSLADIAYRVRGVADALGWSNYHLAGHSLGGGIASILAVAEPQAVSSLIMLDSVGALSEEADGLPGRLQRAFSERRDIGRYASRIFADKEAAVAARLKAARMAPESARLIVERQTTATGEGWQWSFDPEWRLPSFHYFNEAQIRAILSAVEVPTLTLLADDGFPASREETEERLACLHFNKTFWLPGHHHTHMDAPAPAAVAIRKFLEW